MKTFLSMCLLFLSTFFSSVDANELFPRLRPENDSILPLKFRLMTDDYLKKFDCSVSRDGLDQIRASASGQFSEKSFEYFVKTLPTERIVVLDLRREFHGFINGCAVGWKQVEPEGPPSYNYNIGMSLMQIEEAEIAFLQKLLTNKIDEYITDDGKVNVLVESISTERQLVEKMGFEYIRLPITDHEYPLDEEVDQIVEIVKSLPQNSWIHIHCAGGEGRSTTVMCMVDMMFNSHLSPLEIMQRQEAIGGSHVYDPENFFAQNPGRLPIGIQRRDFLEMFHRYCVENPNFTESWSVWYSRQSHLELKS